MNQILKELLSELRDYQETMRSYVDDDHGEFPLTFQTWLLWRTLVEIRDRKGKK